MKNLFFSSKEKTAFYIPDYYPDQYNLFGQIQMLQKEGDKFATTLGLNDIKGIYSKEILTSSRYKNMRVWWADCNKCPKDAFELGNDWTMWKWIEN